jgi:Na+-translocating ferredoxin:NAD+ oxidoreductase RNF subunit RnfB
MMIIIYTIIASFLLALILGVLLGFFQKVFAVPVDEKVAKVRECLPGANCGGCGFPGCDGFAAAVAAGTAPVDGCAAGGAETAKNVGAVMGIAVDAESKVSLLACQGSKECAAARGTYNGVHSCAAAHQAVNGTKMCSFGCIGFGDCVAVCQFDALSIGEDGLPHVDYSKCTGCGMCVKECPMHLFSKVPASRKGAVALCSNRSENKPSIMKNCKAGCIKCGKCERGCPQKAIKLVNGIPEVDYSLCNSCGTCVEGCPTHVLKLVENIIG